MTAWYDATEMREMGFENALEEYVDADGWRAAIFGNEEGGGEVFDWEIYNPYGEYNDGGGWYYSMEDAKENALAVIEEFKASDAAEQEDY